MQENKEVCFIGLGKMGANMVDRIVSHGVDTVVWDISRNAIEEVLHTDAVPAWSLEEMVDLTTPPRIVWLMVPSDKPEPVDRTLKALKPLLSENDLVVDGGNSKYVHAQRRADFLAERGIHFMDIGVSGGPSGVRDGAALMIGGSNEDFARIEFLAKILSSNDTYTHVGPVGAGHFVKMVHNGIEYGMMQAIAEGFGVLKAGPFDLDLVAVTRAYQENTVIASRLVNWTFAGLQRDPSLADISSVIGHSGEGEWTLETGRQLGLELPVIQAAFDRRVQSEGVSEESIDGFINRIVNLQRHQFGGHPVKKS